MRVLPASPAVEWLEAVNRASTSEEHDVERSAPCIGRFDRCAGPQHVGPVIGVGLAMTPLCVRCRELRRPDGNAEGPGRSRVDDERSVSRGPRAVQGPDPTLPQDQHRDVAERLSVRTAQAGVIGTLSRGWS